MSARIEIRNLSCSFGGQLAVRDVSFTLEPGTTTTLVGASGSGKTTLLRCLAGLLAPNSGQVLFDGRDVTALAAEARGVGLVFQSYALFPHLSVADNIGFGLEVRGVNPAERRHRVLELAEQLGVAKLLERKPNQISGGERQRVALGRALAYRPVLLLLDEPLAALDPNLAESVRDVLLQAIEAERTTVLLVTHDRADALRMGQRVALLRSGELEQIGTPRELYRTPRTEYAAHFFGPGLILDSVARRLGGTTVADTPFGTVPVQDIAGPMRLLLRPEALRLSESEGASARVRRTVYEGNRCRVSFEASGLEAQLEAPPGREFASGDQIRVSVDPDLIVVLTSASARTECDITQPETPAAPPRACAPRRDASRSGFFPAE
jgi:ABC-type Fe3+/spermidine/putrescine transport system ATPase subunit